MHDQQDGKQQHELEQLEQDGATSTLTAGEAQKARSTPLLPMAPALGNALLLRKLMRRREESLQLKAGNREEAPAASEGEIAQQGFSGAPSAIPFQADMERGFGKSFSDVQVHMGPEANAASHALGAEAYAYGNQVAFGSANPSKEVVAHELAHTIQQSGGSSVQTFASSDPDHLEGEADAAAATVVAGGTAEIKFTTGGGGVHKWAGSDHYAIGNLAGQKALAMFHERFGEGTNNGNQPLTTDMNVVHGGEQGAGGPGGMRAQQGQTMAISTGPGTQISMGEASRFGGDYATTPQALKGRNQEGGTKANWNPLDWRATTEEAAMVMTAATNSNHFYPLNRMEWANHHAQAVNLAAQGNMTAAMQQEGFAVHFLQDTFSSGHMAPRSLDSIPHMQDGWDLTASDAREGLTRSKTWHDFFCMLPNGLPTSRGRFHGDNYMDGNDLEIVSNTVRDSIFEVLAAGQGQPAPRGVAGQVPVPDLGAILADPVAGPAWRIMQDAYRADFQKADKNVKKGMTGTTDGGTTYDSRQVLDEIGRNVMGQGPKELPATSSLETIQRESTALAGTLESIHHYVVATFDSQIHLHQDDDVVASNANSPHFKIQELESKFKYFSTGMGHCDRMIDSLRTYAAHAEGDAKGQALEQAKQVEGIKKKLDEWKKLGDDAASLLTWRAATIQRYRDTIRDESDRARAQLLLLPALPPERPRQQDHQETHTVAQN